MLVDLQGAFVRAPDGTGSYADSSRSPRRHASPTRAAPVDVQILTIAGAGRRVAVAVNLTADGSRLVGLPHRVPVRRYRPRSSPTSTSGRRRPVAGSAFVPVSDADTICVFASTSVDVIVDITGSFTAGVGLEFVPVEPSRMIDTRERRRRLGADPRPPGRRSTVASPPRRRQGGDGTLTIVVAGDRRRS